MAASLWTIISNAPYRRNSTFESELDYICPIENKTALFQFKGWLQSIIWANDDPGLWHIFSELYFNKVHVQCNII